MDSAPFTGMGSTRSDNGSFDCTREQHRAVGCSGSGMDQGAYPIRSLTWIERHCWTCVLITVGVVIGVMLYTHGYSYNFDAVAVAVARVIP